MHARSLRHKTTEVKILTVEKLIYAIAITLGWLTLGAPTASAWQATEPPPAGEVHFNRDVRPILSENCFRCHGHEPKQREAGLRLDDRDAAIQYGAILPGDPAASLLVERIFEADADLRMPPVESHKSLSETQKELLRRWIAEGAEYEGHWAYQPPKAPPFPRCEPSISNQIDYHIDAQIHDLGLAPAPPADNVTLLRRVYLDLVGLPPPVDLAQRIAAEPNQDWYPAVVEQLLASPHYGERMASDWLDVVRYADTVGYHGDQNQNVFPYRDWVIDAFNRNMPFDQFTEYQLAGDLIENPTTESLVASCFNRLNMMTREGGAQPKEYLIKYAGDRVRTVSAAWLGTTLGCAECHDHKFDPFTMRDFYSMAAFFADLRQWGVYQDYGYTPNPDLRGWSNDHPFPPEIQVDVPYLHRRIERLSREATEHCRQAWRPADASPNLRAARDRWRNSLSEFLAAAPSGWRRVVPLTARDAKGEPLSLESAEGRLHVDRKGNEPVVLTLSTLYPIQSLRWNLLSHDGQSRTALPPPAGDFRLQLSLALVAGESAGKKVDIDFADAQPVRPRYANTHEILGVADNWVVPGDAPAGSSAVWRLAHPVHLTEGELLEIRIAGSLPPRFELQISPLVPDDLLSPDDWGIDLSAIDGDPLDANCQAWLARQATRAGVLGSDARARLHNIEADIRECRRGQAPVQISQPMEPLTTRVLPRGNWQDETGEIVEPAVPVSLRRDAAASEHRLTRLDLARWLTSPENPLTARVQMNRLWKHFFGVGLSPVLDDLGMQGQYPSHPAVLDTLALEFQGKGWDTKHMVRQMVLSAAYRRSSTPDARMQELDPANIWLARQNARRLEAEIVRDQALAVSGLIDLEMGGPSVFPYQPEDYYAHLQFPDRRYVASADERQYRRGVYMHWQRTFLHPMLAAFDAPSREECTAQRTQANTPLQALTLLNDPTFVEAAKHLALRGLGEAFASDGERIHWLVWQVLQRPASPGELHELTALLAGERTRWRANTADAKALLAVGLRTPPADVDIVEAAAWTSLSRALLNLHESLTRY